METDTLRTLGSLREAAHGGQDTLRRAVEAFMCLMTGRSAQELTRADRFTARRIGAHAAARGAWSPRRKRAHAFRAAYDATASRATVLDATDRSSPMLALENLLVLPRDERAAVALSCLLQFDDGEVAFVINRAPSEVRAIVDAGIEQIRRSMTPEPDPALDAARAPASRGRAA